MARRRRAEHREIVPDAKFGDLIVAKFMNLVTTRSPYFGSGRTLRTSARRRRDILFLLTYFGRLAP